MGIHVNPRALKVAEGYTVISFLTCTVWVPVKKVSSAAIALARRGGTVLGPGPGLGPKRAVKETATTTAAAAASFTIVLVMIFLHVEDLNLLAGQGVEGPDRGLDAAIHPVLLVLAHAHEQVLVLFQGPQVLSAPRA